MKVLHINNNYLGTALHQNMMENLQNRGICNEVFVPICKKDKCVIQPKEYVNISDCYQYWDRLRFYKKQNKIFAALEKKMNLKSFSIIHAYTLFSDGNVALNIKRKYHIPYIVTVRNTDLNVFFKYMPHLRPLGLEILKEAEKVVFLSPVYRDKVYSKYVPYELRKVFEQKTEIIPNGIDDFWLDNVNMNKRCLGTKNDIRVVFVGRMDKNKNIVTTQKALSKLRQNGNKTSFIVVGPVEDKKVFKKVTSDKFTEYIPKKNKNELLDIYRRNDIFVMLSHTESFGLVYAEAMSQGLPVIYTKGQGFDGQFEDGQVGYAVNSNDIVGLCEAICLVYDNYSQMTANAIKGVNKFYWKTICERYVEMYYTLQK